MGLTAKAASIASASAPGESSRAAMPHGEAPKSAPLIVFQSLEVTCSASALRDMRQQFLEDPSTLVVGAKLEGHAAHTSTTATETVGLTGATCPWNTLAMWNTALLSRTGFLQVSD